MKPSRQMHEVYDLKYRMIVSCGSQTHCLRYVANRPSDKNLVIRVAGR